MAFDGGFLHKIKEELIEAIDSHIDKIYQPSRDELVFLLRKKAYVKRLLISVKPGSAHINFTTQKFENPTNPPMFCMLIRKYLSAARLVDIIQNDLERILEFVFTATNEMGDVIYPRLVCELIGNRTNIILLDSDRRIIDCLRKSDIESGERMLQPGVKYEYPESQHKLNPLTEDITVICEKITERNLPLSKAILSVIDGFSPLISREVSSLTGVNDPIAHECDKNNLFSALQTVISKLKNSGEPTLLTKSDGTPFEYTYCDISQYDSSVKRTYFSSYSDLLEAYFTKRENAARIKHAAQDIVKLVTNLRSRTEKKLAVRLEELKKCQNREQLRIYGELLKANLYALKSGSIYAEVQNYYDENLEVIRIPLNPALSPSANAAKYFKDYKKTYKAEQTLTVLTENDRKELLYFDSVLESISRCETISEINEIREELADAGYIKKNLSKKRKKNTVPSFKEYCSKEGYRILVGKNNNQNDYLTTTLANKNDMWFHVKDIPGSHVLVMSGGADLSHETVLEAASIAAFHSKAGNSAQVPVDYTPIKYVKKPNGAKPGMVIYTTNKTVYVTPKEPQI